MMVCVAGRMGMYMESKGSFLIGMDVFNALSCGLTLGHLHFFPLVPLTKSRRDCVGSMRGIPGVELGWTLSNLELFYSL